MNQNFVYQESLDYKHQDIEIDLVDSNQENFYISLSECEFDYNYQNELISSSKISKKQQAFENFKQSKSLYQENKNIQITFFDNNYRKAFEKNQKSVHFNLDMNKIQLITNFENDYYMDFEERKKLYQPFFIHKQKILLEEEDLLDDEDDEQFLFLQNNSINIIVAHDQSLKGILKQNDKIMPLTSNEYLFAQSNFTITKREKQQLQKKIEDHQYGVGLKFLKKYGYECGSGLGLKKQGILEPVQTSKKSYFSQNFEKQQKILKNIDSTNRKKRKIELIAVSDDEQEYCQS